MSSLYLPACAANEYLMMLTTLMEKREIYIATFELNTISGACMLQKATEATGATALLCGLSEKVDLFSLSKIFVDSLASACS